MFSLGIGGVATHLINHRPMSHCNIDFQAGKAIGSLMLGRMVLECTCETELVFGFVNFSIQQYGGEREGFKMSRENSLFSNTLEYKCILETHCHWNSVFSCFDCCVANLMRTIL